MRITLKKQLDDLVKKYQCNYLHMDPLGIVRQFSNPLDQEVAGFIAAGLSIGRYDLIQKAIQEIFTIMGSSPAKFIGRFHPERDLKLLDGFVYRFYRGRDLALLFWWIKQMLQKKTSIQDYFMDNYNPEDDDIGPSLSRFVQSISSLQIYPVYLRMPLKGTGFRHFLADPRDGSGCKRLNLFLRWMVRDDNIDLGLWNKISPSKLIIPLDTHIGRLGKQLALTQRTSQDWKMAVEITQSLRRFDPTDPVKYDFALCTLGKLIKCSANGNGLVCRSCPVAKFCQKFEKEG